jgi:putative oxidoreductase
MPDVFKRLFGRWSEPIGGTPANLIMPLQVLAIVLRLFAGYKFVLYGYDKLLGGNKVYAMNADFFRALNVPLPEVTQVLIGGLELVGGAALIIGLLTRIWAFLLAGNMLVAMLTFHNLSEEAPLFIACALLVLLGGGLLSVDQLLDRRLGAPAGDPVTAKGRSSV